MGFAHGPHPKALKKSLEDPAKHTDEVAVMIDTRRALEVTDVLAFGGEPGVRRFLEIAGERAMKLASMREGRDGALIVVSRDLAQAISAADVAPTLQAALDDWESLAPALAARYDALNDGEGADSFAFDQSAVASPLPRAYQWADGSAYVNHVELVRRARGAEMPQSFWTDPFDVSGRV